MRTLERVRRLAPGEWRRERPKPHARRLLRALAAGQRAYFAATGLWAIIHYRSFTRVTGPKTDDWLVKTVGALVTVIGAVLGLAALRRRITPEIALLATGSAAGLAAIDVFYTAKGRISRVYLLDAAGEAALLAGWAVLRPRSRRGRKNRR